MVSRYIIGNKILIRKAAGTWERRAKMEGNKDPSPPPGDPL